MPNYRMSKILHRDQHLSFGRAVVDFFVMLVMAATASGWFLYCFFQWFNPVTLVLMCGATLFVILLWTYDLRGFCWGLIILSALCGLVVFPPWSTGFFARGHNFIANFAEWLIGSSPNPAVPLHPQYGMTTIFLFVVIICLSIAFCIKIVRSGGLCGIFGICAFSALGMIENIKPPYIMETGIYLSIFLGGCCYFYSGFTFIRRDLPGKYLKWQAKTLFLWLLPVTVATLLGLGLGDFSFKNPDFITRVDTAISNINLSWLQGAAVDSKLTLPIQAGGGAMMQTAEVRLGGSREVESSSAFTASFRRGASPVAGRYYFRVNTFGSYSGKGWSKVGNLTYKAKDFTANNDKKGYVRSSIIVSEFAKGTRAFPAPGDIIAIYSGSVPGYTVSQSDIGDYQISQAISEESRISIDFATIDMGRADGWSMAYSREMADATRAILSENSAAYESKTSPFLQLPANLPQSVAALAATLTEGKLTTLEKAEAIWEHVKSSYNYTTSPQAYSGDFVEHFLFKGKEGYCTYFATAMAIMCRSVGVPSRYVEGYSAPAYSELGEDIIVTGDNAHAWCEVYFPEVGWLIFDPTASAQNGGNTLETAPENVPTPETPPEIPPELPEELEPPKPPVTPEEIEPTEPDQSNPIISMPKWAVNTILYTLAAIFAMGMLYGLYRLRWNMYTKQEKLYLSDSAPRYVMAAYEELMHFARLLHVGKETGETPRLHLLRLCKELEIQDQNMIDEAITCVEAAAYSGAKPSMDLCRAVAMLREQVAQCAIKKCGKLRFIFLWRRGKA